MSDTPRVHVGIGHCDLSRITLAAPAGPDLSTLSARELQVLGLMAAGHRAKEIGYQLFLSPKTVDTHKARVKRKLGIKTSVAWMNLLRALPGAPA